MRSHTPPPQVLQPLSPAAGAQNTHRPSARAAAAPPSSPPSSPPLQLKWHEGYIIRWQGYQRDGEASTSYGYMIFIPVDMGYEWIYGADLPDSGVCFRAAHLSYPRVAATEVAHTRAAQEMDEDWADNEPFQPTSELLGLEPQPPAPRRSGRAAPGPAPRLVEGGSQSRALEGAGAEGPGVGARVGARAGAGAGARCVPVVTALCVGRPVCVRAEVCAGWLGLDDWLGARSAAMAGDALRWAGMGGCGLWWLQWLGMGRGGPR